MWWAPTSVISPVNRQRNPSLYMSSSYVEPQTGPRISIMPTDRLKDPLDAWKTTSLWACDHSPEKRTKTAEKRRGHCLKEHRGVFFQATARSIYVWMFRRTLAERDPTLWVVKLRLEWRWNQRSTEQTCTNGIYIGVSVDVNLLRWPLSVGLPWASWTFLGNEHVFLGSTG
jgi:hypothetical protein